MKATHRFICPCLAATIIAALAAYPFGMIGL
jgi:hypothetical protein